MILYLYGLISGKGKPRVVINSTHFCICPYKTVFMCFLYIILSLRMRLPKHLVIEAWHKDEQRHND